MDRFFKNEALIELTKDKNGKADPDMACTVRFIKDMVNGKTTSLTDAMLLRLQSDYMHGSDGCEPAKRGRLCDNDGDEPEDIY